ncbi:MAG: hypothetical protein M3Y30_12720, partial [Gemmatimonadota bacterium]|nr:hypothetical protein [Gemmatimonadota bacterium]
RAIVAAFGGELFDIYGTSETKEIAWECHEGSRHINSDVAHVEILDDDGEMLSDGDEGEIVITLLVNHAMPLLRYRTGDRGTLLSHRCPCGRSSLLLGAVSGRDADMLELADGSTRSPYQLTMTLERIPGLAQYQIVQTERDLLRVSAVATRGYDLARIPALERSIHDALRGELPREVRIETSVVERLPRGAREKVRPVHPLPRSRELNHDLNAAPGASK